MQVYYCPQQIKTIVFLTGANLFKAVNNTWQMDNHQGHFIHILIVVAELATIGKRVRRPTLLGQAVFNGELYQVGGFVDA